MLNPRDSVQISAVKADYIIFVMDGSSFCHILVMIVGGLLGNLQSSTREQYTEPIFLSRVQAVYGCSPGFTRFTEVENILQAYYNNTILLLLSFPTTLLLSALFMLPTFFPRRTTVHALTCRRADHYSTCGLILFLSLLLHSKIIVGTSVKSQRVNSKVADKTCNNKNANQRKGMLVYSNNSCITFSTRPTREPVYEYSFTIVIP